jgi:co-chaperonin GroES (HSP10)
MKTYIPLQNWILCELVEEQLASGIIIPETAKKPDNYFVVRAVGPEVKTVCSNEFITFKRHEDGFIILDVPSKKMALVRESLVAAKIVVSPDLLVSALQ